MCHEDLEHKLLSGCAIYIDNCPTYSISLMDMAEYGFTKFQSVVSMLSMSDEAASNLAGTQVDGMNTFLLILGNIYNEKLRVSRGENIDKEKMLGAAILKYLSMLFRGNVECDFDKGFVINGNTDNTFVLTESNYDEFRKIIKYRNCLMNSDDEVDENPANEMAKKLLEKQRLLREKIRKTKTANGEETITMSDLISIFAEAEGIPLSDVYNSYDIYQFNNQFNRLKIMDDFHVNIQALLAGAKPESVKIQHWISKINKNND